MTIILVRITIIMTVMTTQTLKTTVKSNHLFIMKDEESEGIQQQTNEKGGKQANEDKTEEADKQRIKVNKQISKIKTNAERGRE